jgi:putative ABC transport system permease protein
MLIVLQVLLVAALGAVLGAVAGNVRLRLEGDARPAVLYTVALGVALVCAAAAAAMPAGFAARRDPIAELRVP